MLYWSLETAEKFSECWDYPSSFLVTTYVNKFIDLCPSAITIMAGQVLPTPSFLNNDSTLSDWTKTVEKWIICGTISQPTRNEMNKKNWLEDPRWRGGPHSEERVNIESSSEDYLNRCRSKGTRISFLGGLQSLGPGNLQLAHLLVVRIRSDLRARLVSSSSLVGSNQESNLRYNSTS